MYHVLQAVVSASFPCAQENRLRSMAVLVGRANKLRWTKVYKGSELRGDGGGSNEKLFRGSVVSPTKPPCYASYREKKAFLILEKSFEGR